MLDLMGYVISIGITAALFWSSLGVYHLNKRVRSLEEEMTFVLKIKVESLEHQLRCVNARIKRLEKVNNIAEAMPITTSVYTKDMYKKEEFNACMG